MQKQPNPKGALATRFVIRLTGVALGLCTGHFSHSWADTVYRCGEAYSASAHCHQETASELKPQVAPRASSVEKSSASALELKEAQALEKRRLQSEREAIQSVPARISSPSEALGATTKDEYLPLHANSTKKRTRKIQSPYFTAVAPNANPKKKSTAQAVPANNP
jgi:hypothetical protein